MAIDQKLKICVVSQQVGKVLSGPGVHTRNLIEHLVREGHQVVVVSLQEQEPAEHAHFRFIGVPPPFLAGNQARWLALSYGFSKVLRKLEAAEAFDLIHFTDARDAFFARTRAPRIGNVNDTYSAEIQPLAYYRRNYADAWARWGYYRLTHAFEKRCLPRLDAVIANSRYTARTIQGSYPGLSDRVFMIYKSIEAAHFKAVLESRQNARQPVSHQVLLVGSNLQRKGIRYLIEAAPEILARIPGARFKIAGGDPAIPRLAKYAEKVCGADRFYFLGNQSREQINQLYAEAGVFVLPALTEALGIVFLEAMASGVPVIGTRVGGIPEIIEDERNGLLVPPEDPPALAQAVVRLMKDRPLADQLVGSGLTTVRQFTVQKMMEETFVVYERVLGRR